MQQRVALARALAPRPDVLLLDEPFSSLDQAMRTQLRAEVREILREARQSAIFVTHDQGEALTVADRVAVMTRGRVLQVAAPEVIYAEPATPYVATFIGVSNLVPADVAAGLAVTRFGMVRLIGPPSRHPTGHGLCLLRPEHFSIEEAPDGAATSDAWEVISRRFSGSEILLELRAADGERLWVEAGSRVRHVGLRDAVRVRLRDVETVAFGRKVSTAHVVVGPGVETTPGAGAVPGLEASSGAGAIPGPEASSGVEAGPAPVSTGTSTPPGR
jgi:ABC-type Fe3+/spermidine/putrescine transport system ATPase subunit